MNCFSAISRFSSLPEPQPRSTTRRAPAAFERVGHDIQAQLMQADRLFQRRLGGILLGLGGRRTFAAARFRHAAVRRGVALRDIVGRRVLLGQAPEQLRRQRPLVAQIAGRDQLAGRMLGEPALALVEQLVDLAPLDEIVLLAVEHGDQHVEMRQQIAQPAPWP